tara:strand:- start:92 stop:268 length:177 start_codon:yes stop_codon:yes gene_type:complete
MDYCSNYTSNLQIAIVIMVAAATLAYQVSSISPAAVGAAVVVVVFSSSDLSSFLASTC